MKIRIIAFMINRLFWKKYFNITPEEKFLSQTQCGMVNPLSTLWRYLKK